MASLSTNYETNNKLFHKENLLFVFKRIETQFKQYQTLLMQEPKIFQNDFYEELTLDWFADIHNILQELIAIMAITSEGWIEFMLNFKPQSSTENLNTVLAEFNIKYPRLKFNFTVDSEYFNDANDILQPHEYYFTIIYPYQFKYQILPILCELYDMLKAKGFLFQPLSTNYEILKSLLTSL